ncbi:Pkinase-domain-containing protein [Aureobasidium pullulans]|uniref:Pkinase-domain-containing protein n=1 Tax=Aureobasidium pullulans TaxID=5580 RepID=A0A4S8SJW7_AURPU|nr:Pkinase-domain-containing protein [Aureobasidium pullulans]
MTSRSNMSEPPKTPAHAAANTLWHSAMQADNIHGRVAASHSTTQLPSIHTHHLRDLSSDLTPSPFSSSSSNPNALPFRHNHAASAGLQIRTDLPPGIAHGKQPSNHQENTESSRSSHPAASPLLTPALRHNLSTASLSPNSALASPALAAMLDLTPLPSPIMLNDPNSPGPWKRIRSGHFDHTTPRPPSRLGSSPPTTSMLSSSMPPPDSPHKKKKGYGSLMHAAVEAQTVQNMDSVFRKQHNRNRSISDFVPEAMHNVRPRNVTVGPAGLHITTTPPNEAPMQREHYLAQQRGYVQPSASSDDERRAQDHPHTHATGMMRASVDSAKVLPSPPPSSKGMMDGENEEEDIQSIGGAEDEDNVEYFTVRSAHEDRKRKWRSVRSLGQGTFSKVILATSQRLPPNTPYDEQHLNPRKLVAVKIVEHGPAGGADEERIEISLKREVDILKSVSHPSIVQLKALEYTDERALLVLSYCPGGDLFELASEHRNILQPAMVQRMFAELVGAVRYLHNNYIVHRDIKLENVLVVPAYNALSQLENPRTHPYPLICLTDLGLSRRISAPPASPLLTTRCGSEDYAAPEILLGQPYDGRSTDGWALGVLLYALMESRLPFDCPPGKPERSRPSHRIARADWMWCKFGDEDGEWDDTRDGSKEFKGWEGARAVVEGLLKKVRMGRKGLGEIEDMDWVKEGIQVEGGLKAFDDTEPL